MKAALPYLLVACLGIASLGFKAQRYLYGATGYFQTQVEARILPMVGKGGWHFVDKHALTRLNTSHVMRFQRQGCTAPLFVNVLGNDGSDHHLLASYLQVPRARYILDGRELKGLLQIHYYLKQVIDSAQAVLTLTKVAYSPLIALYQTESSADCSLDISLLRA